MKVLILGTRGIPANHGGFETFAEDISVYLTERGHEVTVYCQSGKDEALWEDDWNGVHRVHIYGKPNAAGTMAFDFAAVRHSLSKPGVVLTLGYNTAVFSLLYRIWGRVSLMNMDGIEWKREKWSHLERIWLRFNEYAGAKLSNHLIADHPEIGRHLQGLVSANKITVIAYGAEDGEEKSEEGGNEFLAELGIEPKRYALLIARAEPENSLLEIVQAFSAKQRGIKLLVLGRLAPDTNRYHAQVMAAASSEVLLPGGIYDKASVKQLRRNALIYLHGHRVGGTNPSLVEALAAGNPIIAQDNMFNRWVAGEGAAYFASTEQLEQIFDTLLGDAAALLKMSEASRQRFLAEYRQAKIFAQYETLLEKYSEI